MNSVVCRVQLVNEDKSLFAESVIRDEAYEREIQGAYDSSRAFSLCLVSESGQRALVGIIFPERSDSFDFV